MASDVTIPVGSQALHVSEIVAAAAAAPFEGGLLAVSPLRPLSIWVDAEFSATDQARVVEFLTKWLGSPEGIITVRTAEDQQEIPVSGMSEIASPILTIDVPASDEFGTAVGDPRAMQRITARLRRPDGCPWDRKQTATSLANNFVDEVYEVVDAIESGDPAAIAEELGDLFLLIMLESQIGHEAGAFSVEDVYAGIARKIVGRHPHVFGEAIVETDADLSGVWAEAKAREQAEGRKHGGKDIDGEPFSMPALVRASRVLTRQPIVVDDNTPEFLRIVAEIIARGDDPEAVLKQQLRDHVLHTSTST